MASRPYLAAVIVLAAPRVGVTFQIATPGAATDWPLVTEFEARRAWFAAQPRDFENAVLFRTRNGEVVRSDRFTQTSGLLGDFDGDGDVDRYDYMALQICLDFSGPGVTTPTACAVFDADGNQAIDLYDVAAFAAALTGSLAGVHVEAGEFVPILASPDGYYSGEPGTNGNNALNGVAAQAGYSQDDLWYRWRPLQRPVGSGDVLLANASRAMTAYTILAPALSGSYGFGLTVTNLVTGEMGFDAATLSAVYCINDAACDDGLFCTGSETCDPLGAGCVSSGDPCEGCPISVCREDLGACTTPSGEEFFFTLATDNLTGICGNDTFNAPLIFNAATGSNYPSLQTNDRADGGDGNDILNAQFNFASATTVIPMLTGIETLNLTDFGTWAPTLDGRGITGVTTINLRSSGNPYVVRVGDLPSLVDLSVSGQFWGAGLTFAPSAARGADDAMTLTLNRVLLFDGWSQIDLTSGGPSRIETLNLVSNLDPNDPATHSAMGGTNELSRLNLSGVDRIVVTGTAALTISYTVLANEIDASGFAQPFRMGFPLQYISGHGVTVIGGSGGDTLLGSSGDDLINGGEGNDTIDGREGNDTIDGSSGNDSISGEAGNDNIYGSSGDDSISGSSGNDRIDGGEGNDNIYDSYGDNIINGGDGNDNLDGSHGNNVVTGGLGVDTFRLGNYAYGFDYQVITDFDDTVTTGDVLKSAATLSGTDDFATSASIQTHSSSGNLTVEPAAEVVVVRSNTVTNFTDATSRDGTNLLTAIGGTITGPIAGSNRILLCVADASGNVGVYLADSYSYWPNPGAISAGQIMLVAVLQGPNVNITDLVYLNFSNNQ